MTEAVARRHSHRGVARARRWALPAAVAVAVAMAWGADRFLTRSPMAGIVPLDVEWIAVSGDFPAFWRGFEASDVQARLARAGKFPQGEWIRRVRQETGIRPTPSRWRNWLGPGLVCARMKDATGFSARPGILLHACHWLFAPPPDAEGIRSLGDWAYAWRDGFLVASRSRAYVSAAVQGKFVGHPADDESIQINWSAAPSGEMIVHAADGLPSNGRIDLAIRTADAPLALVGAFPTSTIAAIHGSSAEDLRPVTDALIALLPGGELVQDILGEAVDRLPREVRHEAAETAFAWAGVDMTGNVPIPDWMGVQRRPAPLTRLPPPAESVPFEWNRVPGWVLPWIGERLSFCMAEEGTTRYWTGREGLMPGLAGQVRDTSAVAADVVVEISWERTAVAAIELVRWAGARELVARRNAADVEREIVPNLELLLLMGNARLLGQSDGTGIRFDGHLALTSGAGS